MGAAVGGAALCAPAHAAPRHRRLEVRARPACTRSPMIPIQGLVQVGAGPAALRGPPASHATRNTAASRRHPRHPRQERQREQQGGQQQGEPSQRLDADGGEGSWTCGAWPGPWPGGPVGRGGRRAAVGNGHARGVVDMAVADMGPFPGRGRGGGDAGTWDRVVCRGRGVGRPAVPMHGCRTCCLSAHAPMAAGPRDASRLACQVTCGSRARSRAGHAPGHVRVACQVTSGHAPGHVRVTCQVTCGSRARSRRVTRHVTCRSRARSRAGHTPGHVRVTRHVTYGSRVRSRAGHAADALTAGGPLGAGCSQRSRGHVARWCHDPQAT
jgi:hypothetical protein